MSPRTASSVEFVWFMRPEVREKTMVALQRLANPELATELTDDMRRLVDGCLFSSRLPEMERVRKLALLVSLWGGAEVLLDAARERVMRLEAPDRVLLGPNISATLLAWFSHDRALPLDAEAVSRASELLQALPQHEETLEHLAALVRNVAKSPLSRVSPLLYPALAPSETNRLAMLDVTDLARGELAEEIVATFWRIFVAIGPTEWAAYARHFGLHSVPMEEPLAATVRTFECDTLLSMIQFTLALKRWVVSTVVLKLEKPRVIRFWCDVADLCVSINGLHAADAIFEALDECLSADDSSGRAPLVRGWPTFFPASTVKSVDKLRRWHDALSPTLTPYVAAAMEEFPETGPTQAHAPGRTSSYPPLPPLALLLSTVDRTLTRRADGLHCNVGITSWVLHSCLFLQNALRHCGVPSAPLSHDMFDLLQAMPLLPDALLSAAARASQPRDDLFDSDTYSSDRVSSSDVHSGGETQTPPTTSRSSSPVQRKGSAGSAGTTPRSPKRSTPHEVRSDLGMSLAYRIDSAGHRSGRAGGVSDAAADMLRSVFFVTRSGVLREELQPLAPGDFDIIRFLFVSGSVRVSWVRGLSAFGRLLAGRTPLGFHISVVDDALFGWRLLFKKPSEFLAVVLGQWPAVGSQSPAHYLLPTHIAELDSHRSLRRNLLYIIKRWVEIERMSLQALTSDPRFMELWMGFFLKIKEGCGSVAPVVPAAGSPPSAPPRRTSVSSSRSISSQSLLSGASVGYSAEEFICASSIDWVLQNTKARSRPLGVPPAADWSVAKSASTPGTATQLAEALTWLEQAAFCNVGVDDVLGFGKQGESASSLQWLVQRFNRTSLWVASCVLVEDDLAVRAQLVVFFMRMAVDALALGNVMMSFAVYSGLESLSVARLKQTWAKVALLDPKRGLQEEFDALKDTFSPVSGQQSLRFFHIVNMRRITLPFMGLWTKDLFLIDRNNPSFLSLAETSAPPKTSPKRMVSSAPVGSTGSSPPKTLNLWGRNRSGSVPDTSTAGTTKDDRGAADAAQRGEEDGSADGKESARVQQPLLARVLLKADGTPAAGDWSNERDLIDENRVLPPGESMCDVGDANEERCCVANMEKLTLVADAVSKILFFQTNEIAHPSGVGRAVVDPIAHAPSVLSEEALYKLSLRREPRAEEFVNPLRAAPSTSQDGDGRPEAPPSQPRRLSLRRSRAKDDEADQLVDL